jgi:membrane dipeptidase
MNFIVSLVVSLFITIIFIFPCATYERTDVPLTNKAIRIHKNAIVIDGHNDLPFKLRENYDQIDLRIHQSDFQTDIPRLINGGINAQFWIAYVPVFTIQSHCSAQYCYEQIDLIHRMIECYPDTFELALTAKDIKTIHKKGKIASLIGVEGGHAIEKSLVHLRNFYRLGARYMTLTHNKSIEWADAATDDPISNGLSDFGKDVIKEMNRLGMLVDISHVSEQTMVDVLDITQTPIMASHSNAYHLSPCARNIPDHVLKRIKENNGIVMVNFFPSFLSYEGAVIYRQHSDYWKELRKQGNLSVEQIEALMDAWEQKHPTPACSLANVIDHIDYIRTLIGIDHVGLGSDFDGISIVPTHLEDVSCFVHITQALLNRGYRETDIKKVLGENILRVMSDNEAYSKQIH